MLGPRVLNVDDLNTRRRQRADEATLPSDDASKPAPDALPDGTEVTLQQQDKRLLVKAGRSRFTLQTLPAEDFPRLAKPSGVTRRWRWPSSAPMLRPR